MSEKQPITIAFADDHRAMRVALCAFLESSGKIKVLFDTDDGTQMLERLVTALPLPDICIVDIRMKEMDGYQLLALIRKRWPLLPVLVYTMYEGPDVAQTLIKRGANGHLSKGGTVDDLIEALEAIHSTGYYYTEIASSDIFELIRDRVIRPVDLSETEMELLHYAASELSMEEIAVTLATSSGGLRGRFGRLMEKINVKNRQALVLYAVRVGLIPIDFSHLKNTNNEKDLNDPAAGARHRPFL